MTEPIEIDDVIISDDTDFTSLVRNVLLGSVGTDMPNDVGRSDWLLRAYMVLQGSAFHGDLASAVADCLGDEAVEVRLGALAFFVKFPDAPGSQRLIDVALNRRDQLDSIPSHTRMGVDPLSMLLRFVGARIMLDDARAIEVGRREALTPGDLQPLIAALTIKDTDWVVGHAEDIVRSSPSAGLPMLASLRQLGRDLLDVGRRVAPLATPDERFLDFLERVVDDPAVCEAIRRAADAPEGA